MINLILFSVTLCVGIFLTISGFILLYECSKYKFSVVDIIFSLFIVAAGPATMWLSYAEYFVLIDWGNLL